MPTGNKMDRPCVYTQSIQARGTTYDMMDVENNATIRDVWERKHMFYIEDKHMNQAEQITVEEEMMVNPNMEVKDIADSFWGTYGRLTGEEVKYTKDRLTISWQQH